MELEITIERTTNNNYYVKINNLSPIDFFKKLDRSVFINVFQLAEAYKLNDFINLRNISLQFNNNISVNLNLHSHDIKTNNKIFGNFIPYTSVLNNDYINKTIYNEAVNRIELILYYLKINKIIDYYKYTRKTFINI